MNLIRDLVLLATLLGFCGLCVAYVWLCERIIGPDTESDLASESDSVPGETPAAVGNGVGR